MLTLGLQNTYAEQLQGLYDPWTPGGFPAPEVVQLNRGLADELGLDQALLEEHAAWLLSGTRVPADASPLAQAYAGHQFGGFSPQLGDGRAVLLGELGIVGAEPGDDELVADLLEWMHQTERDFTSTFRRLSQALRAGTPAFEGERFDAWSTRWRARLGGEEALVVAARMDAMNPLYIPRNHLVEEALDAAIDGDLAPSRAFLEVLERPYTE